MTERSVTHATFVVERNYPAAPARVFAYEMGLDDARVSVSLATIAFRPEGTGTRMIVTEQGAYLDGLDTPAQREAGTNALLDQLGTLYAASDD